MSLAMKQLAALVRVALKIDLRSGNPLGGSKRSRSTRAYVLALVFYFFVGLIITGATAIGDLSAGVRVTVLLAVAGTYVAFNILVEYHQILLAPTDGDVLYWRPIPSRVLFLARALHILLYANILTAALLVVPSVAVALQASSDRVAVWCAFVVAGSLNAVAATAWTILIYGVLLRRVAPERLQDALAYVQVGMGMVLFLGYQALGSVVQPLADNETALRWMRVLPAAWYAALPEGVGWGWSAVQVLALGAGVLAVAVSVSVALRRLAPRYEGDIAQVQMAPASGADDAQGRRARWLQQMFAGWVVRNPLRRAGFEFFLANLRGDRRIKVGLLPIVALPLALVVFNAVLGAAADPYGSAASATSYEGGTSTAFGVYFAVYFLSFYTLSISRTIVSSPSWRAGWIFYAAPIRRFDRFYSGVLWGVFYGLILPAIVLLALLLLALWRNPLHVLAHLSLPCGLALLAFPLALRLDVSPPFSRQPARHERSKELLLSFILMLPLGGVGTLHYFLREHIGGLVFAGFGLAVASAALWWWVNRHVSTMLLSRAFEE